MHKYKSKLLLLAALLVLAAVLSGCAGGVRGYARYDNALLQAYRNYEYNPAYNYYWYGAGNNYYALIGLNPDHTVPIYKMWRAIEKDDPEMRAISNFLWERFPTYVRAAYHLVDPFGKIIGEIYTSTTFSYYFEEDNSLIFYFSTPWMQDYYVF